LLAAIFPKYPLATEGEPMSLFLFPYRVIGHLEGENSWKITRSRGLRDERKKWRKCMGIEPTRQAVNPTHRI